MIFELKLAIQESEGVSLVHGCPIPRTVGRLYNSTDSKDIFVTVHKPRFIKLWAGDAPGLV